ncbi:MAG: U32 family peptidase [Clostridia bacterium]|nr:U32 family peptidase [Clostridia bacterium]
MTRTGSGKPTYPDHLPRLPELLAPAGSPEALEAALGAGADAVYLGGSAFNARMNAHNFNDGELRDAVSTAHRMGGRIYLTLNTLIWDRELTDAVRAAYAAAVAGVDGLIIADVGAAALIRRALPSLPLHASTQLSGHNAAIGTALRAQGFSRFVIARETRLCDLKAAVRDNPLEVEVFIHGALCVCTSGQCLFSSLVGGRSGNRGECAQPCRLPYAGGADGKRQGRASEKEAYPLSLKDLSLCSHVPALIDAGVSSLKIEGRMKSPGYVAGVTAVWRRLLDERRSAIPDEVERLSALFSRGGFTDGYFTGHIDHAMMGVRSDEDKEKSAGAEKANDRPAGFVPVSLRAEVKAGQPVTVTASAPRFRWENEPDAEELVTVSVSGDVPDTARNPEAALTEASVVERLGKVGGTAYDVSRGGGVAADVESGLLMPASRLNALRREALDALDKARLSGMPDPAAGYDAGAADDAAPMPAGAGESPRLTARFDKPEQITRAAEDCFGLCFLPLERWKKSVSGARRGVVLPGVIFDREAERAAALLADALRDGCGDVMVGNVGHLSLIRRAAEAAGVVMPVLHGDFRLNVTNRASAAAQQRIALSVLGQGYAEVLLSPELTLPRLRDLHRALPGAVRSVTYGRIPLMLLEKCVIRELYPGSADPAKPDGRSGAACAACARGEAVLRDRKGVAFPVLRTFDHRNVIYNSLPLSMTDRADELLRAGIDRQHFIFSVESPAAVDAVIRAAQEGTPVGGEVRRIK